MPANGNTHCKITKLPTAFTFCPKFLPNCKVTPQQQKRKRNIQQFAYAWARWQDKGQGVSWTKSISHLIWNRMRPVLVHTEPTHKGVNKRSKVVTQIQQQRPELPTVTLTWHVCKHKVHKLHQRYILCTRCTRVTYLVFTDMRLRSLLLYLCNSFQALINSLVCWFISHLI